MRKKERAAIAAVVHHMACRQQEAEEPGAAEAAPAEAPQAQVVVQTVQHPWALSGRQGQMQMRTMMQMKAFH
ncbi:MAG: hypothetical protein K9K62_11610 [Desulfobacteraceae bacterium]|nr:hypothetical protein [Desulfobacteraceae bacterium]